GSFYRDEPPFFRLVQSGHIEILAQKRDLVDPGKRALEVLGRKTAVPRSEQEGPLHGIAYDFYGALFLCDGAIIAEDSDFEGFSLCGIERRPLRGKLYGASRGKKRRHRHLIERQSSRFV